MRVIDVSHHNALIDWVKVKAAGIEGVIIRAGYGRELSQKDQKFEANYAGAKAVGLPVGVYWYSYADTVTDAITEACVFLEVIKGKTFELPLYFDIEEPKHVRLGKNICTAMVENFCSTIEEAGYFAGVYSFDSFFATNLSAEIQDKYTCWVARVEHVKPTSCKKYDVWQCSWKGYVSGITGDVDMNECYKDFPVIIKNARLNGFIGKQDLHSVTAKIDGVPAAKANVIRASCVQMGMDVTIT